VPAELTVARAQQSERGGGCENDPAHGFLFIRLHNGARVNAQTALSVQNRLDYLTAAKGGPFIACSSPHKALVIPSWVRD
jgi:hypothetical protein